MYILLLTAETPSLLTFFYAFVTVIVKLYIDVHTYKCTSGRDTRYQTSHFR